jgi:hypothetical protein
MGYAQIGESKPINDTLTFVSYKKEVSIEKINSI